MTIGIITVRNDAYHPNRRLKETAREKGCSLYWINPYHFRSEIVDGKLLINGLKAQELPDVVIPRQGALIGDSSLTLINQIQTLGIPLVNGLASILLSRNQFLSLQALAAADIPVLNTVFINRLESVQPAVEKLGGYPLIAKTVNSYQGKGVFLINSEKEADFVVQSSLDRAKGMLIQQFLQQQGRQDVRVFIIGGEITGAMQLLPREGDFRSNFSLNQQAFEINLTDEMKRIAVKAARTLSLEIAGVDLLIDIQGRVFVLEVNYSPGFKGLEATTGLNIAEKIIDYAISLKTNLKNHEN